jgi:iron complex outermembrane recepter protein
MHTLKTLPRLVAAAIAAGLLGGPALAQQAQPASPPPAQPQPTAPQLQRVEVTGSNIKRTTTETAAPITVITREEMQRSGATTLGDVIQKLTVAQGGLQGVEFSGFTPGAATIALRGLGGGSTLILINGRRIAPYGITGFQEIITSVNSIPVTAVDRIDILKDGASAIYGSEAIAGVVNIILRRDYTGFEAAVTHTTNQHGELGINRVNLAGGFGDISTDKFNVFGTYELLDQKAMTISQNQFYPTRNFRGVTGADNRSAYSYPGNFFTGAIESLPGCEPRNIRTVGGVDRCVLDQFEYNTLLPSATRNSLLGRATYDLSANVSLFAELGFSRNEYGYSFDPQFYTNEVPGVVTDFLITPAGDALLYRAGDLGPRRYLVKTEESRLLFGTKGTLGIFDFDSAIGRMQNKVDLGQRGSILWQPMEAAIANGTYVPGAPGNSPAVIAGISPELTRKGKATTTFADARLSTEFGRMPGGAIGVAAGVEYREETIKDDYPSEFVNGEVYGFGALEPLDTKRKVGSAYGELNLPVLRNLEVQLAARFDKYSVTGNSTTPKVGVKWTALPQLVVRGTYAEGFRAPNAREISTATSVGFFNGVQDPVRCPVIDPANVDCDLSIQANISGNPRLEPERSKSYTWGFVLEPVQDVSITLDFWRIERRNEIGDLDINFLLGNQGAYTQFIRRDATGSITDVDLPYVNLGKTVVRGQDLEIKARFNLGEYGRLSLRGAATHFDNFFITPAPGATPEDYNGTWGQPRFRSTAAAQLERGPWNTELSYNHVHGYKNNPTPSSPCSAPPALSTFCEVGAFDTWGLFIGYKGVKNLELGLLIDNLLNSAPPFDYRSGVNNQETPWLPLYHNGFGRIYQLQARYKFY